MRSFISSEIAETKEEAGKLIPWAAHIVKCDGGWMCFEFVTDYETWEAQV